MSIEARSDSIINIAVEKRMETEEGLLIFDGTKRTWLPKSLVEENDDGTFAMPSWLAQEKGLI